MVVNIYAKYVNLILSKYMGEVGKDFIHVHHKIPIHTIGQSYKIDYAKDLIPVCPNCHAMLHRKINGIYYSVSDLKKLFEDK